MKTKALHWGNRFVYCTLLNSNKSQNYPHEPFIDVLAVGNENSFEFKGPEDFSIFQQLIDNKQEWLFGHIAYDLKNHLEDLDSKHNEEVKFPLITFFAAESLVFFHEDSIEIKTKHNPHDIYEEIIDYHQTIFESFSGKVALQTSENEYVDTVNSLINHIIEGDIYEINYCVEFLINELQIDPVDFYQNLCLNSPTPFSTFYKNKHNYALGASPERFLKKVGQKLISQPIKGTARRGSNTEEDHQIIEYLRNDEKERAENMMIVDLVRNDLARSSKSGSVKVEEMFGIYSFRHWHQMISTVTSEVKPELEIVDIIKNAFPMGSMTGAPKIKVMQLVEKYETFKRGLYSGAIGYITPEKDFDFNVVIRTLFYDQLASKGAFMVGSAITYDAKPHQEYKECLLKARPILETLQNLAKKQPQ
ncbi:anthranilate synthase component I family protein [Fulvivirga sp. RKSG066]|nr:anthranilate synthase component I family protein [Fulvivirga aurantia]